MKVVGYYRVHAGLSDARLGFQSRQMTTNELADVSLESIVSWARISEVWIGQVVSAVVRHLIAIRTISMAS